HRDESSGLEEGGGDLEQGQWNAAPEMRTSVPHLPRGEGDETIENVTKPVPKLQLIIQTNIVHNDSSIASRSRRQTRLFLLPRIEDTLHALPGNNARVKILLS